ncbi:MAG: putative amine oxidase [Nocardia sp.]|nr:putative amine oxidase [Nocardia sp.]
MIGSGVAGLTAAYVLAKHDRVTLYERDSRLGGHAHTHEVEFAPGKRVWVDSGFLVHNDRTYPTLLRLFEELGVQTRETDMSMSVRADALGLEYAGAKGLGGLFSTARMLRKPRYLRMLTEIRRFHRAARELLRQDDSALTLAEFLREHRFSAYFTEYFMTPLVAAVWSCDPGTATQYPAQYLFRFLDHHGMLTVYDSPTWRTVVGGSARYVEKIATTLDEVRTGTPVLAVAEHTDHVLVTDRSGVRRFDAAVLATHPQQALALLADPSPLTEAVLGAMPYSLNPAQLPEIDSGRVTFAGAYHGWGFHEDGALSGLRAAERLGGWWPVYLTGKAADAVGAR